MWKSDSLALLRSDRKYLLSIEVCHAHIILLKILTSYAYQFSVNSKNFLLTREGIESRNLKNYVTCTEFHFEGVKPPLEKNSYFSLSSIIMKTVRDSRKSLNKNTAFLHVYKIEK